MSMACETYQKRRRAEYIMNGSVESGKPHNLVCSQCRNPDNLMPCETCCRSYHSACLPAAADAVMSGRFYCPSCKQYQWDQAPPQFSNATPSPNASRSSTPSARGSVQVMSPGTRDRMTTPLAPSTWGIKSSTAQPPPGIKSHQYHPNEASTPPQYDLVARARNFLLEYGHFPPNQEFRLDLLLKVGTMMAEVESHRSIHQELQELRAENANLRSNASLRGVSSNLPSSYLPPILPSPAGTESEKSWDRIVTDLI
ncbi:hypothetical protein BJX96DRAFT_1099 [Aspergillus floccosus]